MKKKINMKVIAVTIFLMLTHFFIPATIGAQNIKSISGVVLNSKNDSLLGNAVLLSVPDSGFIKGASFISGVFEITDVNRKEVFLKLTSLEFSDTIIKVVYNGQQQIDLGRIVIKDNSFNLNVVDIVGRQSLIRYAPNGNIELKVGNTALANSSSASEILSKAPNVIETEGRFSVFGKGEAIIYLNGKQISSERMASIPSSQIEKIEIISNPSSKYDSEGKAVINIITKTKMEEGIMGTLTEHLTYSDFAGGNANTFLDLNYMKNKFSLVGNYSILSGKSRERLHTTRTRPASNEYMSSDLLTNWNRQLKNFSNFGLGAQYNIDEKNDISLAYSGSLENLGGTQDSKNHITTNLDNGYYTSSIKKKDIKWNHSLTLNYNHTIDTLGSTFFIGSQYSNYNSEIDDFISEDNTVNGTNMIRFLKNNVDHDIDISSTQTDYTKVFNVNRKIEAGAKYSYVSNISGTDFFVAENNNDFIYDTLLSNTFTYIEQIPAAYLNYIDVVGKKFNIAVGARGEWTNYSLNTTVTGKPAVQKNYFNIFPNASINTSVSKNIKLRVSYAARITRPRYQSLNPLVVYQDPFTTIEGNPNLVSEKTHAFELGANCKGWDMKVGYTYSIDPIDAAALRGTGPNSYVLKILNLEKGNTYLASVSKTVDLKWWTSINTLNLTYLELIDHQYNFVFVKPRPQLYFYSSNTFNISNLFRIQLLGWYLGDKYYGLYHDNSRFNLTVSIEKDFFKSALKLKLMANDIFTRTYASGTYGVGQTDIYYNRTFNNSYLRFIVTYNFGKLKNTNYKNKETGQNENNRAS